MHSFATVDLSAVDSWSELDRVWAEALGFPDWYGHNRDAWLDIMSNLDEIGMVQRPFEGPGAILIRVQGAEVLSARHPQVLAELVQLSVAANKRYARSQSGRELALVFEPSATGVAG
jgi:hypothetical protein